MKLKKTLCILLMMILMGTLFVGCISTQDAEANTNAAIQTGDDTQEAQPEAQDETITLTIGGWNYNDYFVPIIQRELSKKYPDIVIEYEPMTYEDYINKLKVNLSGGTAWDIMMLESGSLLNATKDYCLPINELAEEAWGTDWENEFIDVVIDRVKEDDGTVYGLPDSMGLAGMLMYNKTKLEQHNVSVPKTYEELKTYAHLLRSEGDLPVVIGGKDTWIITDIFTVIANDIAPGKLGQADLGEIKWTDPDLIKAFEVWQNIFTDGIFQDGSLGVPQYPGAAELFWQNGQGGALTEGDWSIGTFTNADLAEVANKDDYIIACMPDMNGDGNMAGPVFSTGVVYAINKNISNEKIKAAWDYIRWFIGEEGPKVMNGPEIGYASTPTFKNIEIERSSEYENYVNCMNEVAELAKMASGPRDLTNVDAKAVLGEVLQELGTGMSPQEAADKMQSVME